MTTLQDWLVRIKGDGFTAPELLTKHLEGAVFRHPKSNRHPDGKYITTSSICGCEGRVVTTASGTKYKLGRVNRKYRAWMKSKGLQYDRKNSVKMVK